MILRNMYISLKMLEVAEIEKIKIKIVYILMAGWKMSL
jgi:hypothetical protein